jgi:hypothetical protein
LPLHDAAQLHTSAPLPAAAAAEAAAAGAKFPAAYILTTHTLLSVKHIITDAHPLQNSSNSRVACSEVQQQQQAWIAAAAAAAESSCHSCVGLLDL